MYEAPPLLGMCGARRAQWRALHPAASTKGARICHIPGIRRRWQQQQLGHQESSAAADQGCGAVVERAFLSPAPAVHGGSCSRAGERWSGGADMIV